MSKIKKKWVSKGPTALLWSARQRLAFPNCMLLLFALSRVHFGTLAELQEARRWENRVYLATYPRSGNHWMRYLIEEATGIATSSVYRDSDPRHLKDPFPWGGYCCDHGYEGRAQYPTDIVVVKTHFPFKDISLFDRLPYRQAIRIIRHPVDSFYSLYRWDQNYRNEPIEDRIPRERLLKYIATWSQFQKYWDGASNVFSIRYEDLCRDPTSHLRLILKTIGYSVAEIDVARAVERYPSQEGSLKYLDHFTEEDLALVETELGEQMRQYGYQLREITTP